MDMKNFDVVAIGNAIVDVIVAVDDPFLADQAVRKGSMTLIDMDQATLLYKNLRDSRQISGGSAANTAAGISSLGGTASFIGRVRDDELGEHFANDIKSVGVNYETPPATEGKGTASCYVFVTPDAQRTMMTFLGASTEIGPDDVENIGLKPGGILYIEGYLWDADLAKQAVLKAVNITKEIGGQVAFSASDSFCVERHRSEFRDLLKRHVDILFANEDEIISLYETDNFEDAAKAVASDVGIAALTRSEKGSVIVSGSDQVVCSSIPVDDVIDTTGAGDLFAAGFLFGLANKRSLADCAGLGGIAAAEVISHYGARPEQSLAELVKRHGF